jgi:hypothetical protein
MDLSTGRADGSRPQLAALGLASLPILGLLVFAIGMALGTRPAHVPMLALALVIGCLSLVPLLLDQARPPERRHIFITLLSLNWGIGFALPVFTRYFALGGYDPSLGPATLLGMHPADVVNGQILVLVGFVSMLTGYATPLGALLARAVPKPRRDWSLTSSLGVALVMIPLGWALFLMGQFGLVPRWAGSGVLGVLAAIATFGIALLMAIYLRFGSRLAFLALWMAIPPTMGFNFFTGSKGMFFAPLAMVALTYVVVRRRFRIRWGVAAVVAFALFFPINQFYREVVMEGLTKRSVDVLANPQDALNRVSTYAGTFEFRELFLEGLAMTSVRFSGLDLATIIFRDTPARVPFQGGWTIGYVFLAYIPRVLWPGKPLLAIGQWVTDNYAGGPLIRSQTGPTWVGELYFNFGWAGVVLGMLTLGTYFRVLNGSLYQAGVPLPVQWTAVAAAYYVVPAINSSLTPPINVVPFYGGVILAIHLVVMFLGGTVPFRRSSPTPPAAAPSS